MASFSAAFKELGYTLGSPRQDWSAESETGVCLSLWRSELRRVDGTFEFDSKRDGGPFELWGTKAGNKKRIQHVERALREFDGLVDVVIVEGEPGEGVKSAAPWLPAQRKNTRWKVTAFEADTGHLTVRLQQ